MIGPDPANAQYPDPFDATPLTTSVQPLETSEQGLILTPPSHCLAPREEFMLTPLTLAEARFRHSGWAPNRARVWTCLCHMHANANRLDRFRNCGSALFLAQRGNELILQANHCHDRWCEACGRSIAQNIRGQLRPLMKLDRCRFLTLTMKHNTTPLTDQVDRLLRSFSALRRRSAWKNHVDAAASFFEIKRGNDGLWHPHLHVITQGSYWAKPEIEREWHCVTGDSYVVHIRAVPNEDRVRNYVTKYVSKPVSHDVYCDPDSLSEAITALKGRRLVQCYGAWRGVRLRSPSTDDEQSVNEAPAKCIGSLTTLLRDARNGEERAMRYIEAALRKWPRLQLLIGDNSFKTTDSTL